MRKIFLSMGMSLDGFFEGLDGDISWHQVDDELHQHMNDTLRPIGGFLMGRRTFELMDAYWPNVGADPDAAGPERDFASIWRDTPKIVYSRTMEPGDDRITIKRDVDPAEIGELKAQPGGDLVVGGAELADDFRRHGLIDEYRVFVHPVLVGRGRRLFADSDELSTLTLLETRRFSNGVTLLRYTPQ